MVATLKSRRLPLALLALALAAVPLLLVSRAEGASNISIYGTIRSELVSGPECQSPVGLCLKGQFRGSLNGPNEATGFLFIPQDDGVIFGKSHVVVHDIRGDIMCTSSSSFDITPVNNSPFSDLCIITGGTGKWAGASGWFHTFGNGGATGNAAEYKGTIKLP